MNGAETSTMTTAVVKGSPVPDASASSEADTSTPRAPPLPRGMYRPSILWGTAFALYAPLVYAVPAWLAVRLAGSSQPLTLRVLGCVALFLVAQHGLHLLGWLGHEGFHFSLLPNKYVSTIVGIVVSSMALSHAQVGVAIPHWLHHRYTNGPEDPDTRIFSMYQTPLRRLFLGRLGVNRVFIRTMFRAALGRPLGFRYVIPFRPRVIQALACLNIACSAAWIAIYIALTIRSPLAGVVGVLLPHVFAVAITAFRPYLEHADTARGKFRDARSYTSPVMTFLFLGNNFHLEHHLYPSVPCYRLPGIHKRLAAEGYYARERSPITTTFFGALATAIGRAKYPTTVAPTES